jgi:hypothetical protein
MALSSREISQIAMAIRDRLNMLSSPATASSPRAGDAGCCHRTPENFGRRQETRLLKVAGGRSEVSENWSYFPGLVYDIGAVEKSADRFDAPIPCLGSWQRSARQRRI